MTTTTLNQLGPVLVSELPPTPSQPSLWTRLKNELALRLAERRFEYALHAATPAEQSDLMAAARRA